MAAAATLDRLELRVERLRLTFRFTYAFHAREVRFECDRGQGFERIFPETFSFHAKRHDPAELFLQLQDLASRPSLLAPEARARDAQLLTSRLLLQLPRHLEALLRRLESDPRLGPETLLRVWQDVALIAQIAMRFAGEPSREERPGLRTAAMHLRKLVYHALYRLLARAEPAYIAAYVAGKVDPVDPADDLSETGFFATLEGKDQDAINRCVVRLAERYFYRWLEDVCLDDESDAFGSEDSPFDSREDEVHAAIHATGHARVERGRDLVPFLRRPGNKDCMRVLFKLQRWFLRQYDVHHAAVMIQHANHLSRGRDDADRVLSRHGTRNYVFVLVALALPFVGAALAYDRSRLAFDALCSLELALAYGGVLWFLLYRFLVRRDLAFFHASVPRIMAGIIVGYLPIFFIDEIWSLVARSFPSLAIIAIGVGLVTLLYLYIEVQRRLGDSSVSFDRAMQLFLLGLIQSTGLGLVLTSLIGPFMAARSWSENVEATGLESLRHLMHPFVGQLPVVLGIEPLLVFPSAVFVMAFMSFFIGTFLQLLWEDLPITEPL
ncbi:MAG TPA: hypothetical protein VFY49_11740 [Myxococcota bacterium]|nr:hypothetical protein [Myxococcota bacterium]